MNTIRKFRPDVEVLRTIAVVAVVISHSKLALGGGFVGVDIFFVISGFLITKHIHDEILSKGTFSLKSFYARRILRILPASIFVLVLTLVASFIWLSPLQMVSYAWDGLLASFSGLNYRLAVTGTDYFASTTTPSPFQHFWSLAVEEQFYLVWPLLILIFANIFLPKNNIQLVSFVHHHESITAMGVFWAAY
jgi:peptidoglycan/LPS O-acetylase OafA/YrhL